jgi:predicted TPR repeat methyltransferase
VSADTLVYFGPLEPVVGAAENALRPGGRLIFTVEELVGAGQDDGYSIGTSGRYRHARDHVQRVLKAANLRPEVASAELRLEGGEPVGGLVVLGTKPAAD